MSPPAISNKTWCAGADCPTQVTNWDLIAIRSSEKLLRNIELQVELEEIETFQGHLAWREMMGSLGEFKCVLFGFEPREDSLKNYESSW